MKAKRTIPKVMEAAAPHSAAEVKREEDMRVFILEFQEFQVNLEQINGGMKTGELDYKGEIANDDLAVKLFTAFKTHQSLSCLAHHLRDIRQEIYSQ